MEIPYILPSNQIRTDGIYFLIRQTTPSNREQINENSFYFEGLGVRQDNVLITFSQSINKTEFPITKYGLTGVFSSFVRDIKNTPKNSIYPIIYEVTYNAQNLIANHFFQDDDDDDGLEETIVCTLYKADKETRLQIQKFIKHFNDNSIEEKGDYFYDFMSFNEIEKGIPQSVENSLYPVRKKRKWWDI